MDSLWRCGSIVIMIESLLRLFDILEQFFWVHFTHYEDTICDFIYREEKNHLWEKAVGLISENESRIREEVQLVAGNKECVWRWLDVSNCTELT